MYLSLPRVANAKTFTHKFAFAFAGECAADYVHVVVDAHVQQEGVRNQPQERGRPWATIHYCHPESTK